MGKNLNEELADAITSEKIDYEYIELLLDEGADPLGPLKNGETALEGLFCDGDGSNFPAIISMFINKGFDCSRILGSEGGDDHLELWSFTFSISKGACEALKIMIDNGLKASAIEDFVGHFYTDSEMCDGSDVDAEYEEYLTWAFKMIMLCASYPHILENSEYLRNCIEMDSTNKGNHYNLERFRDYDAYTYQFDYSTMDNIPYGMRNAGVKIIENHSGSAVWEMSI